MKQCHISYSSILKPHHLKYFIMLSVDIAQQTLSNKLKIQGISLCSEKYLILNQIYFQPL